MVQYSLAGQSALVTGASSGIGEAVALALGEAGANVVVNYISKPETAEAIADKIRSFGSKAIAIHADVSKEDEVQAMFAKMIQNLEQLIFWLTTRACKKMRNFTR